MEPRRYDGVEGHEEPVLDFVIFAIFVTVAVKDKWNFGF
jgi:hypothetical protein